MKKCRFRQSLSLVLTFFVFVSLLFTTPIFAVDTVVTLTVPTSIDFYGTTAQDSSDVLRYTWNCLTSGTDVNLGAYADMSYGEDQYSGNDCKYDVVQLNYPTGVYISKAVINYTTYKVLAAYDTAVTRTLNTSYSSGAKVTQYENDAFIYTKISTHAYIYNYHDKGGTDICGKTKNWYSNVEYYTDALQFKNSGLILSTSTSSETITEPDYLFSALANKNWGYPNITPVASEFENIKQQLSSVISKLEEVKSTLDPTQADKLNSIINKLNTLDNTDELNSILQELGDLTNSIANTATKEQLNNVYTDLKDVLLNISIDTNKIVDKVDNISSQISNLESVVNGQDYSEELSIITNNISTLQQAIDNQVDIDYTDLLSTILSDIASLNNDINDHTTDTSKELSRIQEELLNILNILIKSVEDNSLYANFIQSEIHLTTDNEYAIPFVYSPSSMIYTLKCSDSSVVSLEQDGRVKALKPGRAVISFVASTGATLDACIVEVSDPTYNVKGVSLNRTSLDMLVGDTFTLSSSISPSNATNKTVHYSSSNALVATVNNNGVVDAVTEGYATITATTQDGGYTAQCLVTVNDPTNDTVPVTGVKCSLSYITLNAGTTKTLPYTVLPSTASNKTVNFTSSDLAICKIDKVGTLTGVTPGNATVTITTQEGNYTSQCLVRVLDEDGNIPIQSLSLSESLLNIATGETEDIQAILDDETTSNKVKWVSSNPEVASIITDTGLNNTIQAKKAGTAVITATANNGTLKDTCLINVTTKIESVSVNPTYVELDESASQSVQLNALVEPWNVADDSITFVSGDTNVANVDRKTGLVTPVGKGATTIRAYASDNETYGECVVNVIRPLTSISLNSTAIKDLVGSTYQLKYKLSPTDPTNNLITWSYSNEGIIEIDDTGFITLIGEGTTTVTCASATDPTIYATCKVEVTSNTSYDTNTSGVSGGGGGGGGGGGFYLPSVDEPILEVVEPTPTPIPNLISEADSKYIQMEDTESLNAFVDNLVGQTSDIYSMTRGDVATVLANISTTDAGKNDSYLDIPEDSDLIRSINTLDIWRGYSDGNFHPEKTLTRAEFCSLIYSLDGQPSVTDNLTAKYTDLVSTGWYITPIEYGLEKGYVIGTSDTTFHPNNTITLKEFKIILARLLKLD